jgi:hypothetical protein
MGLGSKLISINIYPDVPPIFIEKTFPVCWLCHWVISLEVHVLVSKFAVILHCLLSVVILFVYLKINMFWVSMTLYWILKYDSIL